MGVYACYIDENGEYQWTDTPDSSWKLVPEITKPNEIQNIVIHDSKNNCEIHCSSEQGYIAYNSNKEEIYHIYPDGTTSIKDSDGNNIVTNEPLSIDQMSYNMIIYGKDGHAYIVCPGKPAEELISYSEKNPNSNITVTDKDGYTYKCKNGDYTYDKRIIDTDDEYYYRETILNKDGSYSEIELDRENSHKVITYYDKNGVNYKVDNYLGDNNCVSSIITADGWIYLKDSKVVEFDDEYDYIGEKTIGNYEIDDNGNYIIKDLNGNTTIYNQYGGRKQYIDSFGNTTIYNEKGQRVQYIDSKGKVYDINDDTDAQITTLNGRKSYSKFNHIEYDEEAYHDILNSLNGVGSSYKGVITSACSNIESAVNSFPDGYSSAGISSIGSSVEGHIGLISSLGEMTNYSLLAYQTCDESLREGLYLLIDNLFGDNELALANRFKNLINNTGMIILKDSNGNPLNIFANYNIETHQFGGNQNKLSTDYQNKYVDDIISKYFPNATNEEKKALADKASVHGCGYIGITNYLFKQFEGNESGFYNTFGFPMYEIKCKETGNGATFSIDYNYEAVAMDLFCDANLVKWDDNDIELTTKSANGCTIKTIDHMIKYLKDQYNVKFDNIPDEIKLVADHGYSLYNLDGTLNTIVEGRDSAHAMVIVGQTEDGKQIVSSWGNKYIYEPSENDDYIDNFQSAWEEVINNE